MTFRKQALIAAFAAVSVFCVDSAVAQVGSVKESKPGVVIEILVHGDSIEVVCPTTQCDAKCRDLEVSHALEMQTYYEIGSNCSITITDGSQLNDAIETLLAFLGEELPGGAPSPQPAIQNFLQDTETNQNQVVPQSQQLPGVTVP